MYPSRFGYESPKTIEEAIALLDRGAIRIGAVCRHEDLVDSEEIAKHQPTLAAAAPLVSDPIVRTRGTFVGSLCHADPQGDFATTMIALGGRIVAQGPKGKREIEMKDFVLGPFQTALAFNEIAIEAIIPTPKGDGMRQWMNSA